jgi:hypothetical protein
MFVLKNLPLPTKVFLICSVFYYYYFDKSVYYFHMFTGMLVDLKVHHGGIVRHTPFSYVDDDVHDVPGYDVQFFTMWELKELVQDFGYMNDFKCWYNVGAEHEQVIALNTDVDIVDFLSVIEDYKPKVVHLYVEHTVDHAVMINEGFVLEYSQTQVGEGGGGVDEVQMGDREDGDGVNTNEQRKDSQATPSKSPHVRVKTKAACKLTPSRKKTSTASVPHCEQPSEHPTASRGGRNYAFVKNHFMYSI